MLKLPTFSYNLPYESHEKKSSYEVEKIIDFFLKKNIFKKGYP